MERRILQIWLDESGDFDSPIRRCPVYILGMAIKSQDLDIVKEEKAFTRRVSKMDGGDYFVHTGNLIRNEEPYRGMPRQENQTRVNTFNTNELPAKNRKVHVTI